MRGCDYGQPNLRDPDSDGWDFLDIAQDQRLTEQLFENRTLWDPYSRNEDSYGKSRVWHILVLYFGCEIIN